MRLIFYGFFIHAVLLASVFDIYFKSPIIQGIEPYTPSNAGPAQRVVLFVTDGLRADSFYKLESEKSRSPYLRSIIENRGSWGVSHTRVPTETRPGHVALIAGFYEDPSSIIKGWKENPVEFDSTFNESRYTWSWGSPDVLPMFAKGASGDHVFVDTYSSDDEDFSGATSTTKLDTWVFDKVKTFLNEAKEDETLYNMLQSDKIILFLHLLGLDSAGHTHKPHSKEYSKNIKVVDNGIRKIEQIIEEFYSFDNRTAYVMTADHGMTDWGSHGAGDASETETPLLAWGAGISGPRAVKTPHASPDDWHLEHLERRDVKQADIAPLMACLIGAPIPVNSVGSLPIDYLDVSEKQLSEAMMSNARQMAAQYSKSREITELGTISWLYTPFKDLPKELEMMMLNKIQSNFKIGNHEAVIEQSQALVALALAGLDYYQNYYQSLLLGCVTLTFIGWIVWLIKILNDEAPELPDQKGLQTIRRPYTWRDWIRHGGVAVNVTFLVVVIITSYLIEVQLLPIQFYVYCILPEVIWWAVARHHKDYLKAVRSLQRDIGGSKLLMQSLLYLVGIEIVVISFFHRWVLSVGVIGLSVWPLTSNRYRSVSQSLLAAWLGSCAMLAVFPMLPVVGRDSNIVAVTVAGHLWLALATFLILRSETHLVFDNNDGNMYLGATLVQMATIPLVIWNLQTTSATFESKEGLLLFNQLLSWILSGLSMILVLLGSPWLLARLFNVTLGLAIPFMLLSITYEGIFLLALTVNMLCWLAIEHDNTDGTKLSECIFEVPFNKYKSERVLRSDDFRRAFFFLLYIIVSFFGTGNVASINSFDPAWVRAFISVFSPFTMTVLILLKTLIPFLTVTCTFRALNVVLEAPVGKLFLIFLIFGDIMGLHFLYLVTNKGSWLDIGTSISHFVIIQSIVLFLVVLYGVARVLTGFSLWPASKRARPLWQDRPYNGTWYNQEMETGDATDKEHHE